MDGEGGMLRKNNTGVREAGLERWHDFCWRLYLRIYPLIHPAIGEWQDKPNVLVNGITKRKTTTYQRQQAAHVPPPSHRTKAYRPLTLEQNCNIPVKHNIYVISPSMLVTWGLYNVQKIPSDNIFHLQLLKVHLWGLLYFPFQSPWQHPNWGGRLCISMGWDKPDKHLNFMRLRMENIWLQSSNVKTSEAPHSDHNDELLAYRRLLHLCFLFLVNSWDSNSSNTTHTSLYLLTVNTKASYPSVINHSYCKSFGW